MATTRTKAAKAAAAAPKGTPATPKAANIVRAANVVQAHGLAALPRLVAATGNAAASVNRYRATVNALSPAFAATVFTLTRNGLNAVAANGCIGSKGQATVMGLTAVCLANAGNGSGKATGQAIALAMLGNPAIVAALQGTKANGVHIVASATLSAKWVQGYVNGLCRPAHGLATR
jgi:hypothetical protein